MGMASNQQKSVGAQPVSADSVCDLCRFCRILVAVAASGQGWDLCMVWFCHRLQQSNSLSQHCPEDVLLCTCLVTVCCCALLALLPRLWVHQAPVFLSELDSKLPAGFMRGLGLCCCCRGTAAPGSTGDGTIACLVMVHYLSSLLVYSCHWDANVGSLCMPVIEAIGMPHCIQTKPIRQLDRYVCRVLCIAHTPSLPCNTLMNTPALC